MMRLPSKCFVLFTGLLLLSIAVQAKTKKLKAAPKDPQDEITVVGRIPLKTGSITRFTTTQHYSSRYLYAERDSGKSVMIIDVTRVERPTVLADVPYPSTNASASLFAVAGTAVVVTDDQAPASAPAAIPQTIRVMDFSDPLHPKVAREFRGVTAIGRGAGGLIFVADAEDVWILQQRLAQDPEVEKEYARQVLYQ
jgi:hypothetical protein